MNVTDRVCNLECVKEGNVHEFVGPVKIVLVDPPEDQYKKRKSGAAFVTLASLMMGANTFCMLLFCLGFKLPVFINSHILLCTIGYQFCMPFGILMMHSLFGAAAPMKKSQRRVEHFGLQFVGMGLYAAGTAMAVALGEDSVLDPPEAFTSYHFFAGCVAAGFAGLCFLTGPWLFLCKTSKCIMAIHRIFGVLAFISASVCFILGVIKPTMNLWLYILGHMAPMYLIVFFCAFYTLVVITTPLTKFCEKNKKCPD